MNFFVLKEGNHIEYETMAFFHAYTMEIEISANSMWNLWYHFRGKVIIYIFKLLHLDL